MNLDAFIVILGKLALVLFLVLLNGFFVAAEFAVVKIRDTQLIPLISKGHRRAKIARRIITNLDASLSATQLGITLASLALGWVGKPVFASLLAPVLNLVQVDAPQLRESISFAIGFSIITFLHIVIGELAPKSLAIQKPLPTSLWVAVPFAWFFRISYPFNWVLNNTALWILRKVGIEPASEMELMHSEEELRLLVAASGKQRGATPLGQNIVLNAFDLRRRIAREVMLPRNEIVGLDTEDSLTECLDIAERTRHSRFPLCQNGDLDQTWGVVHVKDLFAVRLKSHRGADLLPVARELIYVPEIARLEKLLQCFLERKLHFAIVVDEYGGTVGMVTLENILEELVGPIQDEFDQERPLCRIINDRTWELAGSLPLHELAELVGESLHEEGITTTSGWVTHRLGGFPKTADCLRIGRYELRVEEMDGPRVDRLSLRRLPEKP